MKTITKLKEATQKNQYDNPIKKTPAKTVAKKRFQKEVNNEVIQEQKRLRGESRALEGVISKNTKKLDKLNAEIDKKTEKAIISGDEIIKNAKKTAQNIIDNANKEKNKAKSLLEGVRRQTLDLDDKKLAIDKLAEETEARSKEVSGTKKELTLQMIENSYKVAEIEEKRKEVNQALDTMLTLLLVVIDKVIPVVENSDELLTTLSKNIAKADKIYTEVTKIENIINSEKEYIKSLADEVNKKEIWVKDRIRTLARASKEIKK